jgi:RNA-binding protein
MHLSPKQRKHLKGLAHPKHPIVTVADKGLSPGVLDEVERGLLDHELIKVKFRVGDREVRDALIGELIAGSDATLVTRIGNIAVLYRPHPEAPKIKL